MLKYLMCSSRKYPYSPHIRFFLCKMPSLWKFKLSFMYFFMKVWSYRTPLGNTFLPQYPPWGHMDLFWNFTIRPLLCNLFLSLNLDFELAFT